MTRPLIYFAHPVGGDVTGNIARAYVWLSWLMKNEPAIAFEASWLACIASGADDSDPVQRERGMLDNLEILERCDGIVLCGGRISSGMQRELDLAVRASLAVYDLTELGAVPLWQTQLGGIGGFERRRR